MCGIAGIFAFQNNAPNVDRTEAAKISMAMRTRGPDGEGSWVDPDQRICLLHRRLAIIDLSANAAQPMADLDTGNQIIFNGEIYNYHELRTELTAKGYCFRTNSDTEVLLKLYSAYGHGMLQKLRGMFTIAIWDSQKNGLFLARDPFGIKPLYVANDGRTLRFASQVKALLAGGEIDTSLEPAGHVSFFLWGNVAEPYTLYRGIRALAAGSYLWLDRAGNCDNSRYFDFSYEIRNSSEKKSAASHAETLEALHSALAESVRYHMVSDVPVGVFLSSGLDSATLTALASEACSGDQAVNMLERIRTFTLGFKEFVNSENDEVPLAESIARHYQTSHTTKWVGRPDFEENYDNFMHAMDQPTIDGLNSYFVSKAAAHTGLKVAISGLGGDELFAGYPTFRQIPKLVNMLGFSTQLPGLGRGFRYCAAPLIKGLTSPKYASLFEYGGSYEGAYLLRRGLYMPWELPDILDGEIVKQGWRDMGTLPALRQTITNISDRRLKVSAMETEWYMRNQLLRDTDWASMAHSLEVRVPMVDVKLICEVAGLVASGHSPSKLDMALAPQKRLPENILNRPKTGFSIPVKQWMRSAQDVSSDDRGNRGWAKSVYDRQFSA